MISRQATVRISMTWKRHDDRKVIVAPDGGDAWPDDTLIRALARAHRWKGLLEERKADRLGNWPKHRVSQLRQPAAAAHPAGPDIVEAILEGRPPKGYGTGGVDRVKGK